MYKIGIDIGGTTTKIGIFSAELKLIDDYSIDTNTADQGIHIIPDACTSILKYFNRNKMDWKDILGIGIGIPGIVKDNIIVDSVNTNIKYLKGEEIVTKYFPFVQVVFANDANAAALAEISMHEECNTAIMITLGTGVGGGIIIDGKILEGSIGIAGEIGHIAMDHEFNFQCSCGHTGCLETVASATGVIRVAQSLSKKYGQAPLLQSCKDVYDLARLNNEVCLKAIEYQAKALAKVFADLSLCINPDIFIIGGGVSEGSDLLFPKIKQYYEQYKFKALPQLRLVSANLGTKAGIIGAARLANSIKNTIKLL